MIKVHFHYKNKPALYTLILVFCACSMTDNSFSAAETNTTGQLRPANSMQGFTSVSLRVPSYDPLPLEDPPAERATANIKQGVEHKKGTVSDKMGGREEGNGGGGRGGGEGGMVVLNPDNRTNLRDVTHPQQWEGLCKSEMVATTPSAQSKHHNYTNTSLHLPCQKKPLDAVVRTAGAGGEGRLRVMERSRMDEDGYYLVEKEESSPEPREYHDKGSNAVGTKKTEHMYHVLDSEGHCSKTQTHTMVVVKAKPEGTSTSPAADSLGLMVEDEHAKKSLSRRSIGQTSLRLQPSRAEVTERKDSDLQVSHNQIPSRRTTYSNVSASKVFDDPMYEAAYTNNTDSGPIKQPSSTSSTADPQTMHPRTRSLQTPREPRALRRYGDYEMTADFGMGDVSEVEGREETAFTFPDASPAASKSSSHEPPGMFDDPAYDVGLNLKK